MKSMEDGITKYYADKRKEAVEAKAALDFHKTICSELPGLCKTCQQLEKRLEMARFVGD